MLASVIMTNRRGGYLFDSGDHNGQHVGVIEEYPRNLTELEASFATEEACRVYLARLRWPRK